MTPQRAKELLPIIKAYSEGKQVQIQSFDKTEWFSLALPDFTADSAYRIKPEPKPPTYRPWNLEEVPVNGIFHVKGATCWGRILAVGFEDVVFWDTDLQHDLRVSRIELLSQYEHSTDNGKTWLPCGVLVED